tara:strand:- start:59351 stop:59662 length:312 start_codon:yes stop_codon:yes gene_type:complete
MNKNKLFISFVILSSILTFANESDISVDVVGVKENNIYTIEVLGLDRNKNIFESEEKNKAVFVVKNMVVKAVCNKQNANEEIEIEVFNEYAEGLFVGKVDCSN